MPRYGTVHYGETEYTPADACLYDTISDLYSSALDAVRSSRPLMESATQEILEADIMNVELDLLHKFYNSSRLATSLETLPTETYTAINALNLAIEEAWEMSLNDWLYSEDIKVSSLFAEISAMSGFPIDAGNVY